MTIGVFLPPGSMMGGPVQGEVAVSPEQAEQIGHAVRSGAIAGTAVAVPVLALTGALWWSAHRIAGAVVGGLLGGVVGCVVGGAIGGYPLLKGIAKSAQKRDEDTELARARELARQLAPLQLPAGPVAAPAAPAAPAPPPTWTWF